LKVSRCQLHRWSENGVYEGNCSKIEFEFQHYIKYLRKDHILEASYLTPYGGARFGNVRPDIYDKTNGKSKKNYYIF
jgi:hypothetical protein